SRSSLPASFLTVNRDRPAALHPAGNCPQPPLPSQVLVVQGSPSSEHGLPAASNWQVDEQQSPSVPFPSSHCSPGSGTPFPQRRSAVIPPDASRQKQHMQPNEQACCSAVNVPLNVRPSGAAVAVMTVGAAQPETFGMLSVSAPLDASIVPE